MEKSAFFLALDFANSRRSICPRRFAAATLLIAIKDRPSKLRIAVKKLNKCVIYSFFAATVCSDLTNRRRVAAKYVIAGKLAVSCKNAIKN